MGQRAASPMGRAATLDGLSTEVLLRELRRREGTAPHEAAAEEATNATELRNTAFGRFEEVIATELKLQSEQLLKLGRDQADAAAVGRATLGVFEILLRVVLGAGHELQDANKSAARVELKAQHSTLTTKLETSRSAAAVNLSATKVEMDAAATRMLDGIVEEMRESDGRQLEKAQADLLELGQAHNALVMEHKLNDEALKQATLLQLSTARDLKALDKQYDDLKRDAAAASRALDGALRMAGVRVPKAEKNAIPSASGTFGGFRTLLTTSNGGPPPSRAAAAVSSTAAAASKASHLESFASGEHLLADRVAAIVGALHAACGQRDSAIASLKAASDKSREAESDDELVRTYALLKERTAEVEELRATLEMSSGGETKRMRADLEELAGENKRLKGEVGRLAGETEEARKQVDSILSRLNFALGGKNILMMSEGLDELVERYELDETEIRAAKATVHEALMKLDCTRDESASMNASLSAQVKQLVDQYGAAEKHAEKPPPQLTILDRPSRPSSPSPPSPPLGAPISRSVGASPRMHNASISRSATRHAHQATRPTTPLEARDLSSPWLRDEFNMGHSPIYRLSPEPMGPCLALPCLTPGPDLGMVGRRRRHRHERVTK